MILRAEYLCPEKDMEEARKVALLSRGMGTGQKRMYRINEKIVLVVSNAYARRIFVVPPSPCDFTFIPVGNKLGDDDYRTGVSQDRLDSEHLLSHPDLVLDDRLPGYGTGRMTIDGTTGETAYKEISDWKVGVSTWYGDTGSMVSWHGIGSMDAAQNDYRTYRPMPGGTLYTVPNYELVYYPLPEERQHAPEDGAHLRGDSPCTSVEGDWLLKHSVNSVYRNGTLAKLAPQPVLAACEIEVAAPTPTDSTRTLMRLRVLSGTFVTERLSEQPYLTDDTLLFEAHQLNSFTVATQRADDASSRGDTGWDVAVVTVPALASGGTFGILAQAPLISADGRTASGIIEIEHVQTPALYPTFYGSKRANSREAWVFTIDLDAATMTLDEPAATYRLEQEPNANNVNTTYKKETVTQVLAVAPPPSTSRIVRTQTRTYTYEPSPTRTQYTAGEYIYFGGVDTLEKARGIIAQILKDHLAEGRAWAINNMGLTAPTYGGLPFYAIGNIQKMGAYSLSPANLTTGGNWGNAGIVGVEMSLQTGIISYVSPYWPLDAFKGLVGTTRLASHESVTTTREELNVFGTIATSQDVTNQVTSGYKYVEDGPGATFYSCSTGVYSASVYCNIYIRWSWDVLLVASQSSSTLDTRRYKIAASDPRKNAAIVHEYGRDDAYTLVGVDGNPL